MDAALFLPVLLPLADGLLIEHVSATGCQITVSVVATAPAAPCPLCGHPSSAVHSRYARSLANLPCAGHQVLLVVTGRRFFCRAAPCQRQIFTERLPVLTRPWARITNRLQMATLALGFATCGEAAARLAPRFGMAVTPSTVLRRLRAAPCEPVGAVRVLGVDDWAFKKGRTYGTILVDLERRRVVDLLPDREGASLLEWLRVHPGVQIISRDRASAYAEAARASAGAALQIADRFHLCQNAREAARHLLDRKHARLPEMVEEDVVAAVQQAQSLQQAAQKAPDDALAGHLRARRRRHHQQPFRAMSPSPYRFPTLTQHEWDKQVRRAKRYSRYEAAVALHRRGLSDREVARTLGIGPRTVHRFVVADAFPEIRHRPRAGSILDPYRAYLLQRWQAGCWNGAQLYRELVAQGYTGSRSLVSLFIADLRKQQRVAGDAAALALDANGGPAPPLAASTASTTTHLRRRIRRRLSPSQASWLFVSRPEDLTDLQRTQLDQIGRADPDLMRACQLIQEFIQMLRERQALRLDGWIARAEQSGVAELTGFAQGIRRDEAAVRAALCEIWSQGQVEGQVNRLKLTKRQTYGRASFALLRQRVLHAS